MLKEQSSFPIDYSLRSESRQEEHSIWLKRQTMIMVKLFHYYAAGYQSGYKAELPYHRCITRSADSFLWNKGGSTVAYKSHCIRETRLDIVE